MFEWKFKISGIVTFPELTFFFVFLHKVHNMNELLKGQKVMSVSSDALPHQLMIMNRYFY
jgi:hypothetical protein